MKSRRPAGSSQLPRDRTRAGTRVAIVDAHALVRYGIESMLKDLPAVGDVALIDCPDDAEKLLVPFDPNVLVVPSDMTNSELSKILTVIPIHCRILVMIRSSEPEQFQAASRISAAGYLLQEKLTIQGLAQALALIDGGSTSMPEQFAEFLLAASAGKPGRTTSIPRLTPLEIEVLSLVTKGLSNKEIARELAVREVTVKHCVGTLLAKLDAPNRASAAVKALEFGLLALEGSKTEAAT